MNVDLIKASLRERDAALLSLDKDIIVRYFKKYEIPYDKSDDTVFWAAVHKARLQLDKMPEEAKVASRQWLNENGFKDTIDWESL